MTWILVTENGTVEIVKKWESENLNLKLTCSTLTLNLLMWQNITEDFYLAIKMMSPKIKQQKQILKSQYQVRKV